MDLRALFSVVLLAGALWQLSPAARAADDAKPANKQPVAIAAAKLAEYAGVYRLDAYRRYTAVVDPNGGGLRIRLTGQPFFPYVYVGGDMFHSAAFSAAFTFKRGADGAVMSVTMKHDWMEMTGRRSGNAPDVLFLAPAEAQAFVGTYEWAPGAGLVITAKEDQLYVQLPGQPPLPVYCDRADHFAYEVVNAALTFKRDASGNLESLTLDQGTRSTRATKVTGASPPAADGSRQ